MAANLDSRGGGPGGAVGIARGRWEHFPHKADVGIRGIGATKAEAFAQAAMALTAVVADPGAVRPLKSVPITCWVPNDQLLFVDWLNALIFEMATRRMLFSEFSVTLDRNGRLRAVAFGEALDEERHQPAVEVKGATLAELRVGREAGGQWLAQCVVDV